MPAVAAAYDVFLSYSRADAAAADQLRTRLADAGLKTFLDRYSLPGGKPWQPELEMALGHCRALVVLLGPAGIGGWQHREIQLGLVRQGTAEQTPTPFPVIPVLLPNLQPDDVPLGTFLNLNTWVDLRPGLDEPDALQRLIAATQGRAIDGLTRDLAGLRPYRGLLPFREQDAGLYFGRQRFIDELTAKVRQRSTTNLVAVLGRSGSGKSSIVFAGLFPALRREKGAGQQAVWQILDLRPGTEPLHALIESFDPPESNLTRTQKLALINAGAHLLRQRKVSLAQLVRDRLKDDPGTTRLLLYVDQWEELYTQAQKREVKTDEDKAHAADALLFIDLVLDAAATAPCTLVLSARSDFYADLQTHDALRAAVQDCQVSLGPMTAAELTAAMEGPAKAVGGTVDPELTKKLLRDIGLDLSGGRDDQYDIGKLPLLEYALEQAWAKAQDGRLGTAHYAGLEQALEERANRVYEALSEQQQAAAKRLFVSLVTPGEGREDTRARIVLSDDPVLLNVAEAFIGGDARLIVAGYDATGTRSAEVSHEALIRHWELLRGWIDENRANLHTRSAIVADREEWLKQVKDRSLLIEPGLRLEAARRLRDRPGDVVVSDIEDYLHASLKAEARRRLVRQLGLAASVATAFAMAGLAGWGWYQYTTAEQRAVESRAALIWSRLDFEAADDPRSEASVRALWDLATGNAAVRDAFLQQLAQDRYQVGTLAYGPSSILRAYGLQPEPAVVRRLLRSVLDAIRQTTDPFQLRALAQAVQTLRPNAEQVQAALGPVLEAIHQTTDPYQYQLQALAQAVQILGTNAEQAQAALGPILDAIRQTTDPDQRLVLVEAFQTLGPKLAPEQAQAALGPVLDAIRQTTDPFQLRALAQAVQTLGPTPEQAQAALGPVLDAIRQTTDANQLLSLAQAVQTLRPNPEQAQAALGPVIDAIRQTTDLLQILKEAYQLPALAQALQTLRPNAEQAQTALGPVLDAIRQTTDPDLLQALAQAVETLGPTPEQAQAALGPVLDAIAQTVRLDQLRALTQAVVTLGPKLAPEQAQATLGPVLDAIRQTTDPVWLQILAQAVQTLRPSSEQAQAALGAVLDAIPQTVHSDQLEALSQAVQTLEPNLTPEQAQAALGPVLAAIPKTTNPYQVQALAQVVQTFGPKLPKVETESAIGIVRTALAITDEPIVADAFARAIAVTLPADPAEPEPYVAVMVELLKWPTTAGNATDALLEVLHDRVPNALGKEAGLDATIAWVAATYPDIDLDSPPTFPASGSTGGAW